MDAIGSGAGDFAPALKAIVFGGGPRCVWSDGRRIVTYANFSSGGTQYAHWGPGESDWTYYAAPNGGSYQIHGHAFDDLWSVHGDNHGVTHFDGSAWTEDIASLPSSARVEDVFGLDADTVFVASHDGWWERTGGAYGSGVWVNRFAQMISDTGVSGSSDLMAVIAFAADDVWVGTTYGGNGEGHMIHWNGSTFDVAVYSGYRLRHCGQASLSGFQTPGSLKLWMFGQWGGQSTRVKFFDGTNWVNQVTTSGITTDSDVVMVTDQLGYCISTDSPNQWSIWETTDGTNWTRIGLYSPGGTLAGGTGLAVMGIDRPAAVPAVVRNQDLEAEYTLDISDEKDNTLTADNELLRDYTIQSRVRFRLTCRREQWWADKDMGSRLYTLNTLGQAQAQAQQFCEEAVQDLIDDGELLAITVTEIEEDPIAGTLLAAVQLDVPEGEAIDLGLIPVGA
jgi:phage gp46-like protein